jgi:hypothetical protein
MRLSNPILMHFHRGLGFQMMANSYAFRHWGLSHHFDYRAVFLLISTDEDCIKPKYVLRRNSAIGISKDHGISAVHS